MNRPSKPLELAEPGERWVLEFKNSQVGTYLVLPDHSMVCVHGMPSRIGTKLGRRSRPVSATLLSFNTGIDAKLAAEKRLFDVMTKAYERANRD